MAHGFRHVPAVRTATPPGPPRCCFCGARTDLGMRPHLCKETTFGTAVSPVKTIPLSKEAR